MSIKYWLAVNGNTFHKNSLLEEKEAMTYWCLPEEADAGDKILFYCPRTASLRHQGIYALSVLKAKPRKVCEDNYLCSGYGAFGSKGKLYYVPVTVIKVFSENLKFSRVRHLPEMRNSAFVRRNSQGTVFKITGEQCHSIVKELEELENNMRTY
jgi:predicted RNA-binding protein with PUA-like domain